MERPPHAVRLRRVLEEVECAESVGLDVYGVGEHHRADFAASAPAVVLAAAAGRTERIRLTSAVTVLSSDDPVRVFQDFATLDAVSSGRAEVMAGRGSFIESFPLFGYSLDDYDELFAEKLGLLLAIRDHERVTWSGRHRAALRDQGVYPRPESAAAGVGRRRRQPGVGGAGRHARAADGPGHHRRPPGRLRARSPTCTGAPSPRAGTRRCRSPCTPTATSPPPRRQAADEYYPSYAHAMSVIGRERGWGAMTRPSFDALRSRTGSLVLGDPETVAAKIVAMRDVLGIERFMLHISVGTLPHDQVLESIRLLGTEVAPRVRDAAPSSPDARPGDAR